MTVCMQFIVDMKNKKYQIDWLDFYGDNLLYVRLLLAGGVFSPAVFM